MIQPSGIYHNALSIFKLTFVNLIWDQKTIYSHDSCNLNENLLQSWQSRDGVAKDYFESKKFFN